MIVNCPDDIIVECASTNGTPVDFRVTAKTSTGSISRIICEPPSGSTFPPGTTVVTCTAVDSERHSGQCSFKVTVRDTQGPEITVPADITVPCITTSGAHVTFDASAADVCDGPVPVFFTPPSGSLFHSGTNVVICSARDAAGNGSKKTFNVIVTGDCSNCLQISCPRDMVVDLGSRGVVVNPFTGLPGIRVNYAVEAVNQCTGTNLLTACQPPSGSIFYLGTNQVECLASEDGERVLCSFKVVVRDVTPPEILTPRPIMAHCTEKHGDGVSGTIVNFTVHASDNAGQPKLVCVPPSGSFFPVGVTPVVCMATDAAGNRATNQFHVTVLPSLACSGAKTLEDMPDNWDFELGLTAWESSGDAFNFQPASGDVMPVRRVAELANQITQDIGGDYWRDVTYPVGQHGTNWVGTAENPSALAGGLFEDAPTDQQTGWLRSKSFIITKPYISFLIGGQKDTNQLRVELLLQSVAGAVGSDLYDGLSYDVVHIATGHDRESMRWQEWYVGDAIGRRAILRIVDNSTTGHLNVDDFTFDDLPIPFRSVTIGGVIRPASVVVDGSIYRWDSPVWGLADMHAHPMSYLGFGKALVRGEPDGDISTALANCKCFHDLPSFPDLGCGDILRGLVTHIMEDGTPNSHGNGYSYESYAAFNAWPVFWTTTHQQMWYEWVRRAHDGGLRVLVALCVNNPTLAVGAKGEKKNNDKDVGDSEIDELVAFVGRHNDFMEIALDPFDVRDIVRRGKLAVIIGSELDDIGDFARKNLVAQWHPGDPKVQPNSDDRTLVRNEIQRLYDKGLRYIFPVHLVNNSFGGTAIAGNMLNIANRFLNGEAFQIQPGTPKDDLTLYLATLDFTKQVKLIEEAGIVGPLIAPFVLPIMDVILSGFGVPPGSGLAVGAGLLPVAVLGTTLLPVLGVELSNDGIPSDILPINNHYPPYNQSNVPGWEFGHKNAKGLTPLGRFAIKEMMKRGMMIDIDHMSEEMVGQVVEIAMQNPVKYPLNSGHNSPREMDLDRGENSRTADHFDAIRELGGLYGVGWENSASKAFQDSSVGQHYTQSKVPNDSAGTSKTFAQNLLYGLESMHGQGVAFGTDADGVIAFPGPRFGPQGSFALGKDPKSIRRDQILAQENGVLYTTQFGRPLQTPVFVGPAIDPDKEKNAPRIDLGYAYNKEQGDVFAAIRIYYYLHDLVSDLSLDKGALKNELQQISNALHDSYPDKGRVARYALGLLEGIHGWDTGSDEEMIGRAIYESRVDQEGPLPQEVNTTDLKARYERAAAVWDNYQAQFGKNIPLKRCETLYKQWDINYEGVAHYGLIPDFLQDLKNVGVANGDLSVLFRSAESFARMWTKCLDAADAINHPVMQVTGLGGISSGQIQIKWYADDNDVVEVADGVLNSSLWTPLTGNPGTTNGIATVNIGVATDASSKFFRIQKK